MSSIPTTSLDPPALPGDEPGWRPVPGDPDMLQRPAKPGEVCTCGQPPTRVYLTDGVEVRYCGLPHGGAR